MDNQINEFKGFGCFKEATEKQKEFAYKLGLDLSGIPQNIAEAMVRDLLYKEFFGIKLKSATQKQIKFGEKVGWKFSCMSRNVVCAYIRNLLWELNFVVIKQQQLGPDVWTENIHNGEKRQILSIDEDGLVSFTDLLRPYRYARSLLRCAAPVNNKPVFELKQLAEKSHEEFLLKLIDCIQIERG